MKTLHSASRLIPGLLLALLAAPPARADVVSEGNAAACTLVGQAKLSPPAAYRALALVQSAVLEASERLPGPAPASALAASIAEANRVVLSKVAPAAAEAIQAEHARAMAAIPEGADKERGRAAGEQAALRVLEQRAGDLPAAGEGYRPRTTPGVYVPTTLPVAEDWPRRKPWVLASPSALRPPPPPSLASEVWVRDLQEVRALGAKLDSTRSSEQDQLARFWEATMPSIYFSAVRSVADAPGRAPAANARLYAAVARALDDTLIATFDAKYHYGFWRPLTAIRNADLDDAPATQRDPSWLPLVDTPMHPEYPAAHSSLAAALAAVLEAQLGRADIGLSAVSPTLPGVVRTWPDLESFVSEVSEARVCDGVHFRNSTAVGAELGRKVGALVAASFSSSN